MRLVVAIVLWAISIVTLTWGIAQRTVFDAPESIVRTITSDTKAPVTILHGDVLSAFPGRPTVTVEGSVAAKMPVQSGGGFVTLETSDVFVSYGRTIDVMAWLSPTRHTLLEFDVLLDSWSALPRSGELYASDPRGSDLWLQEVSGQDTVSISVPSSEGMTMIIMSDGQFPAPPVITLTWPVPNEAPWVLAALIIGILTMAAGFIAVILAIANHRKNRGPRRRKTRRPSRVPRSRQRVAKRTPPPAPPRRGRRVAGFVVIPALGAMVLATMGCSSVDLPRLPVEVLEQPLADTAPYPAVTELQFSKIMSEVSAQIRLADEELSINTLGVRVEDPTLSARRTAYLVRRSDSETAELMAIPSSPIRLVMPQQTKTWPRSVFGVIQDEADLESPSLGVVLRQQDPRSRYHLTYVVVLNPQVTLPDLPAADVGAAKLAPDSKLIRITPQEVLSHYSDVINNGAESVHSGEFALINDTLYSAIGPAAQQLRQESFGETVSVEWETSPTDRDIVAFSTANGGAIVLGTISEIETVSPRQSGATINSSTAVRALTSVSQSSRGFDVESHIQTLWYVPPVGSEEGIRVLGFTYSLMGAREVE